MHVPSRKKGNIMQTKVSLFARLSFFVCFFSCYRLFLWGYFQFQTQTSSKEMSSCLFQETSTRQEREREPSRRENRGERKQEQRQKMRQKKKEQAITYLCESEHMNMEESNDSKVRHSKCFPNYQAVANTINMIFFVGFRFPNILRHCVCIRIAVFHLRLRL